MRNIILNLLLICVITNSCSTEKRSYTDYVNPFLGTETLWDRRELGFEPTRRTWGAEVFPGSSLPNAMVQLSPVTMFRAGAGYQYEDTLIYGFSHTNKGHWNLNYIPVMPVTGKVAADDYASGFSHENESARPAYYQVFLNRYGINVELTSSLRCAYHRYTATKDQNMSFLVNLPRSNEKVTDRSINQEESNAFSGYQEAGEKIFFYAVTNRSISHIDSIKSEHNRIIGDNPEAAGAERHSHTDYRKFAIPVVAFSPSENNNPLEIKIGFSFVSIEGAKNNLMAEIMTKSFEQVKEDGDKIWNKLLGKIDVSGGTQEQQRTFYSTLYRSMLWPALRSDVDGRFTDEQGQIVNKGFQYYTIPSFWDDYRNKLILLGMLSPQLAGNVIGSCIDRGKISGFMPHFFHGDHASVFVTGSYLRGIKNFNVQEAYNLMLKNATVEGPARPFLQEYIEKGYISELDLIRPDIDTEAKASVTKTQEYAYDDYAVALMAKSLGDRKNYNLMMSRSKNYTRLYDASTGFMRGRLENGEWVKDFDPCFPYYHYMYREATGWQSAFFAPHDTPHLIEMFGGPGKFETKLDSLYSIPWKGYEAHNLSGFIGQYCHGNQPDHAYPFLYYFIGKPEKSQAVIDTLLNHFYNMGEHQLAYAGMDDAGEMSSWYVLSAIGLYTYSPADPSYIVSVPLFDKVVFNLGEKSFTIKKQGESRSLKSIEYDGKKIDSYFIRHDDLLQGKELIIYTH